MLSDLVKARVRNGLEPLGLALARVGLTPNVITLVGLVLNVAVAMVLAAGYIGIAGIVLLPVAAFDMLDGAVARATKRTTVFGAFLDSTVDRYAEAFLFLALLIYYTPQADVIVNLAILFATVGSLMVSYTRARAEGLGLRCEVGFLPRPERIIILAIGLIVGWTLPVLVFLAVLTNITAIQRMWHVWSATRGQ